MPGAIRKYKDAVSYGLLKEGSDNVFVNGSAAVRVGDKALGHYPYLIHETPFMIEGSGTVFINGKKACRMGDLASCGDIAAPGSSDVFFG